MASQVYNIVTDRVLSLLEHGVVPWKRPWAGGEPPANLVSKKPYRGINPFLLASTGYASPYWLTFKQAQQRGGNVRKGEKATPVIFWKRWQTDRTDPDTGESAKVTMPVLRYYNVFNAEQRDGIDAPQLTTSEFHPIERCESIVSEMPSPPTITHSEPRAWYRPLTDTVNMPRPELFVGPQEYYSTLFHELSHATGHVSRLGRPDIEDVQPFGSTLLARGAGGRDGRGFHLRILWHRDRDHREQRGLYQRVASQAPRRSQARGRRCCPGSAGRRLHPGDHVGRR